MKKLLLVTGFVFLSGISLSYVKNDATTVKPVALSTTFSTQKILLATAD